MAFSSELYGKYSMTVIEKKVEELIAKEYVQIIINNSIIIHTYLFIILNIITTEKNNRNWRKNANGIHGRYHRSLRIV